MTGRDRAKSMFDTVVARSITIAGVISLLVDEDHLTLLYLTLPYLGAIDRCVRQHPILSELQHPF